MNRPSAEEDGEKKKKIEIGRFQYVESGLF
jgi:hypothetical protein